MRLTALTPLAALVPALALAANYPVSKTVEHVDDYHGTKVADPYRWLEDIDSADTKAWVKAQNEFTDAQLAQMPEVDQVRRRLTELWNFPRAGVPFKEGNWYFFTRNDGLQNQSPLFVQEGLAGTPRVLIDPNTLAADGTVAVTVTSPSPDGKWLGYGLARAGSDWNEFYLRDIATSQDAPDQIKWVKFSGMSWSHDAKGFFYTRLPEPPGGNAKVFSKIENRKLHYHRVGTAQSDDPLIFAIPEHPEWGFGGQVSSDGRYLVIGVTQPGKLGNSVYYIDLVDGHAPQLGGAVVKLVDDFVSSYGFIGNVGRTLYFSTNAGAPRGKVIAVDLDAGVAAAKTIVPESKDTLEGVRISAGKIVATYMHDAANRIALFELDGKAAGEIALPGLGSVTSVSGKFKSPELFVGFASFLAPGTVLRHDLGSGKTETFSETKVGFELSAYEVKQVFYPSKDGTKIPLFLVHKKGLKLDGSAAGWLYGYGGFNVSLKPSFAVPPLVWIERGGVYAMVNMRGGGEYGEEWHKAGTKERKQNVFDDFIAAADWLCANGYTSHNKLVLDGRSNGGLLLGAVVNQRPDLCAAAVPAVGVMDMLRYHKFTVGAAWASDYGNSDTPEGFAYLRAYSPLHTVKIGAKYPAVLVTTGDHDDRVYPAHSYKYTAAAQAGAAANSGPILIHIEANAGHGGSSGTSPVSKTIADWALRMGFGAHFAGWGRN
ncbi:MAG: S9 family peptidase [Opitutae bacterium]|nr:S9 family peptidase [Opitutae bacterium]